MQRAGGAMRGPHWPPEAALAVALTGCHAIYGARHTPGPAAAVETPSDRASMIENTTETPSGETPSSGSGATVGTAAGGLAGSALARTLAGRCFGHLLWSR